MTVTDDRWGPLLETRVRHPEVIAAALSGRRRRPLLYPPDGAGAVATAARIVHPA